MCASATLVGLWSTGIWTNVLGSPPNVSALTISGYAIMPATLGWLNDSTSSCFSGSGYAGPGTVNYDTVPDLTSDELALITELYLQSYYNGLAQATMGYGGDSIPWTNARDGDQSITRANPAAIGAVYAGLAAKARSNLNYLVTSYINNQGVYSPRQVLLPNLVYPTFSFAYWGNG